VRRIVIPLTAALMFVATVSGAQTSVTAPQLKLPPWDADFTFSITSNSPADEGRHHGGPEARGEARFDVGHYWTQHVKTEAGVAFLKTWDDYEYESIPVQGLPAGGYAILSTSVRMTVLTPALTYQFLENEFAHPYVSIAARIGFLETHVTRYPQTYTQNRITYSVPALDRTDMTVAARPVVAAGYKSYFNERAFMRSELQASFGADGSPHPALRIGFGFDF
jgi:hypothetical protein